MATVAAVIASTHHPFYYRASTAAGADDQVPNVQRRAPAKPAIRGTAPRPAKP